MLTQAELIKALQERNVFVTPRGLTDWRRKHLLPALASHSEGRGRGQRYYWLEPDIVDRALLVQALLGRHSRADTALLGLWFSGFEVPTDIIKRIWTGRIRAEIVRNKLVLTRYPLPEDAFAKLASSAARKLASEHSLSQPDVADLLSELLPTFQIPDFNFDVEATADLCRSVAGDLLADKIPRQETWALLTDHRIDLVAKVAGKMTSPEAILNFISHVTPEELSWAHARWHEIISNIAKLAQAGGTQPATHFDPISGYLICIPFGGFAIRTLLYLRKFDGPTRIEKTLVEIGNALTALKFARCPETANGNETKINSASNEPITNAIIPLWSGFDPGEFCEKMLDKTNG